jgi:hypothetical protein
MGSGVGPFGEIFMGGMFTVLKVREGLASYEGDPGWYRHPAGTVAEAVGKEGQAPAAEPHADHGSGSASFGGAAPGGAGGRPAALELYALRAGSCATTAVGGRR